MNYEIGQLVYSKRGRDKDKAFLILRVEENFLYLVDGRLRRLDRPKKKKSKHVQPTKKIYYDMQQRLMAQEPVNNKEIEKIVKAHVRKTAEEDRNVERRCD